MDQLMQKCCTMLVSALPLVKLFLMCNIQTLDCCNVDAAKHSSQGLVKNTSKWYNTPALCRFTIDLHFCHIKFKK